VDCINKILRVLVAAGWRVVPTRRGHIKCYPPGGGPLVLLPGTPSDHRAVKNAVARLVRSGKVQKSSFS